MNLDTFYWIIGYVLFLNVYLYWIMGKDKQSAKSGQTRVPERHIFIFSILGGAIGTYLAMYHYRHKTKHKSFTIGIPIIIAIQLIIVILIAGVLM